MQFVAWGTLIGNGHDKPADPSHWRRESCAPIAQYTAKCIAIAPR